jgi:hypothetical protein
LALPLFTGAASSPTTPNDQNKVINKIDQSVSSRPGVTFPGFNFVAPTQIAPPDPVTLDTFAGDCTTPKTVYNIRDTDLAVCAKFTNAVPGWRVIWSNAHGVAVQTSTITAANSTATFTLTTSSSVGDWRVILFEPFGGTVQAVTTFTVVDEDNPKADLAVSKGAISATMMFLQTLLLHPSISLPDQCSTAPVRMLAKPVPQFARLPVLHVVRLLSLSRPTRSGLLQAAL